LAVLLVALLLITGRSAIFAVLDSGSPSSEMDLVGICNLGRTLCRLGCLHVHQFSGQGPPNIVEMFWLGCAVAVAPLIRVVIGSHANRKLVASSLIIIYCLAAIVLWAVVAPIPLVKAH
jgi:hypothetical protein